MQSHHHWVWTDIRMRKTIERFFLLPRLVWVSRYSRETMATRQPVNTRFASRFTVRCSAPAAAGYIKLGWLISVQTHGDMFIELLECGLKPVYYLTVSLDSWTDRPLARSFIISCFSSFREDSRAFVVKCKVIGRGPVMAAGETLICLFLCKDAWRSFLCSIGTCWVFKTVLNRSAFMLGYIYMNAWVVNMQI